MFETTKSRITVGLVGIILIGIMTLFTGMIGVNDGQNWTYVQHLGGEVKIVDTPGVYIKWFAKTWTYERYPEFRYNDIAGDGDEDLESIEVTFNDGGTAKISSYVKLSTPTNEEDRKQFHKYFGGNRDNIKASTKSYLIDCLKSTAPMMSSSENQSARKPEFKQTVEGQLRNGTYQTKKTPIVQVDPTDAEKNAVTVYETTIIMDEATGKPNIITPSPIIVKYKMDVVQFSVTGTAYDDLTRELFAAKKKSYLGAELSKAERIQETAGRLMIIEKGLKEKAEAEAKGNVAKATAVIAAELKAEVAEQTKVEAETKAAQLLSVAELSKSTLLMEASAQFEQAEIAVKTAQMLKEAVILEAEGKKQAIDLSGQITQLEEAMIQAGVETKIGVATALAKMNVPNTVLIGGGGADGKAGAGMQEILMNLILIEKAGINNQMDVNKESVQRKIKR